MRIPIKISLSLATLLCAVVLMPGSAWAGTGSVTKNCPTEPAQNVPITSGETYYGTNCVLSTTGDVDSFTFTASAGDTWGMVVGVGTPATTNICLTLYAPGNPTSIFYGCTGLGEGGLGSVSNNQKLAVAGVYTLVVSELNDEVVTYGLSLERLSPAPADGVPLVLAKNVSGGITAPSAQGAFTFYGATTGTYQVTSSVIAGSNLCFAVYQPNGTIAASVPANPLCTGLGEGGTGSVQVDVTPAQNGTYVVVVSAAGNDATVNYNLEVSCLLGTCPAKSPPPPGCELKDALTYNPTSGTLTMNLTVATPVVATWNGWLTYQNTMESLWSQSQPITEPAVKVTKTQTGLSKSGKVGVLLTLTTPTGGITCSNFTLINTGKP